MEGGPDPRTLLRALLLAIEGGRKGEYGDWGFEQFRKILGRFVALRMASWDSVEVCICWENRCEPIARLPIEASFEQALRVAFEAVRSDPRAARALTIAVAREAMKML